MNPQNQTEQKPQSFWDTLVNGVGELVIQLGCLLALAVLVALPFMPTWLQVLVFAAPPLLIAVGVWWHGRSQKRKAANQDVYEETPS
jgi:membrane protein implicated in regulation of membrane protease activity